MSKEEKRVKGTNVLKHELWKRVHVVPKYKLLNSEKRVHVMSKFKLFRICVT